jgi:hypothetical protein
MPLAESALSPVAQCTRPTPTAPARPGALRTCPTACRAGLGLCGPRWRGARVHAGAVTALRARITVLEHPRRRGYPPGMGVEAIAHWSSLSMGRGRKTRSAAAFSDEARAPVADNGPATGRRERISVDGRREKRGGAGALTGARTV